MDSNLARVGAALGERGVALRPHIKTHKSVEIARRQVAAGAVGLTTATLGEAEVFAANGFEDLFVAYPIWVAAAEKVDRLRALAEKVDRLRIGVDSVEGAQVLGKAATGLGTIEVVIEVDSGEHRTGVRRAEEAVLVAQAAADARLRVAGIFTHGGHSYFSVDATAGAADDEVRVLSRAATALATAGFELSVRSAGSTPTAIASARDGVSEARPGTYVFGDRQQSALGALDPDTVALFVAATVVSASPGQVIVDAGAKALSKDQPPTVEGFGTIVGYPDARITTLYDHHGVVDVSRGETPRLGDVVAVVPNHVCPVANLADEVLVLDGDTIVDRWPVDARARNR
jgi:D-serine deaminase-like pyridoxal phosphate-dependent protein